METNKLMLLACAALYIIHLAKSQNQQGFINVDCGLPTNKSPYNDPNTTLTYISDANFIRGGKVGSIQINSERDYVWKPYRVLRYFPDGTKNCFSLSVTQDTKYLIRTIFLYGNYDGLGILPRFDLYLGPNIWTTVVVRDSDSVFFEEIIHITRSSVLDLCVVKTGTTTPLISAIELRPLKYNTYIARTGSLKLVDRIFFSNSANKIRYPEDVYDRIWFPFIMVPEWTQINTTVNVVDTFKDYNPPQDVIKTAAIPNNSSEPMTLSWTLETSDDQTYAYIYIADIQKVRDNETREFDIIANGKAFEPYRPMKFEVETLFNRVPLKCEGGCHVTLSRTRKSTLPPLINALEVFMVIEFPQPETNQDDVVAIKSIETRYGLRRISWQGDPCVPQQYLWDGLTCEYTNMSTPPRILSLDLPSSELTGIIVPEIQNLTQLQKLDLSNNNLTGGVPEFLAKMKSLLVINLSGNNLSGSIPQALLDSVKKGLKLNIQGNPNLCSSSSCNKKKNSIMLPIAASLASLAAIIAVVALLLVCIKRGSTSGKALGPSPGQPSIETKKRRYTYAEVLAMTNNNERVLGKGGFGMVYHGYINDTEEVAVKLLSPSSAQGYKEFKTEVELLLRVHHVNLVSLIGYCDEGNDLALIYEFIKNGNLKEHLSGNRSGSVLNWPSRLKIAIESALGIEYMHIGCKPPMVHRDVKCTNILLGQHFEAKLADFGLSRSFLVGSKTHVSTNAAGTWGYLDPEYYQKNWLTKKSDVYSFGIVLLELITGQTVIEQSREKVYIVDWAKSMLANGDIESIMDPNLHREYDTGSSRRALELAMSCIHPSSTERPNMTRVAHELNECLEIYENLSKRRSQDANSLKSMGHSINSISDTPSAR